MGKPQAKACGRQAEQAAAATAAATAHSWRFISFLRCVLDRPAKGSPPSSPGCSEGAPSTCGGSRERRWCCGVHGWYRIVHCILRRTPKPRQQRPPAAARRPPPPAASVAPRLLPWLRKLCKVANAGASDAVACMHALPPPPRSTLASVPAPLFCRNACVLLLPRSRQQQDRQRATNRKYI